MDKMMVSIMASCPPEMSRYGLGSRTVAEHRQFHKFIILTIMLPVSHDSAIGWEEVSRVPSGGSRARRFTRAHRVCPGRVHCRRGRSPLPDTIGDHPATAEAGG